MALTSKVIDGVTYFARRVRDGSIADDPWQWESADGDIVAMTEDEIREKVEEANPGRTFG